MKIIKDLNITFLVIVLNLFLNCNMYSQIQKYFPLHLGDQWEYADDNGPSMTYFTNKIVNVDTLQDGSQVFEVLTSFNTKHYYKILSNDSNTVYHLDGNTNSQFLPLYKVNVQSSHNWNSGGDYDWVYLKYKTINVTSWLFWDSVCVYWLGYKMEDSVYAIESRELMKNIGLIYREYDFGIVYLRGCIINGEKYGIVAVDENPVITPKNVEINNYPNPFNGQTIIQYSIPEYDYVGIKIYDILGREVEVLLSEYKESGTHSIKWVAENLTSGIYIAVIKYKNKLLTHKLLYQK